MQTLLATPQGQPTPVATWVSHAVVGAVGLYLAHSVNLYAGLGFVLFMLLVHQLGDAPVARGIAQASLAL